MGNSDIETKTDIEDEMEFDEDHPSKTRLKEEATKLQKLGEKLTTYKSEILRKLSISDRLIAAIEEYNRLPNSHGARRRQLQFIGKLMRDCDYEAITREIERLENPRQAANPLQQEADNWCEKILVGGDPEINRLLESHPQMERQFLRQISREFNRADEKSRPRLRKKLLEYLQDGLS